ncbi:MAG TPA: sigma-70 family RNA polymerase sigma factor [Muribaculum sp.]|jgi:RNA polymerase sigma-70 factor (ECF subfamily)|uniref:sigma-70 family RNA polymerase sigma factor n=1 Tax=Heminiphilus faecis TaxID=2601703 RepID=UPI000EF5CFFB|nr:sigma-70 family RNA polymerase sigma factor [Heminiphilus faecis]RLT76987.1 sigma-70 family RNA polymerase sigma factor [bacterium J10(2018)]HRF68509.1 sigma-70 family RNA polymerase sigma factor [Muribaculum sp.]
MHILTTLTDEQLVRKYIDGNNKAFDTLLHRHKSRLYSYIIRIVKNKDLAEDIFQETFVKIIMTLRQGRYIESGKFSAWLSRIAHNLIIDHFRQEKAENNMSSDDEDTNLLNRRDLCEENIEDIMVNDQIKADVRRIIDALPDPQKEVLVMRYYNDMSFKEIAETTGVSINTALGRMRYAILNMRRIAAENNIVLSA